MPLASAGRTRNRLYNHGRSAAAENLADQRARQFGMTRAQWAVLFRLDRSEGLKQSELAEILDLQPITLTRLLDRLAENGLIERRADPNDRRANRLFLTPAARPMLERLAELGTGHDGHRARGSRPEGDRAAAARSRAHARKPARRHQSQCNRSPKPPTVELA